MHDYAIRIHVRLHRFTALLFVPLCSIVIPSPSIQLHSRVVYTHT